MDAIMMYNMYNRLVASSTMKITKVIQATSAAGRRKYAFMSNSRQVIAKNTTNNTAATIAHVTISIVGEKYRMEVAVTRPIMILITTMLTFNSRLILSHKHILYIFLCDPYRGVRTFLYLLKPFSITYLTLSIKLIFFHQFVFEPQQALPLNLPRI